MVPYSWIEQCLSQSENVKKLLSESMKNCITELTSGSVFWEVHIQRVIYQGDALSPLLFVIAMIPLNLLLRKSKFAYKFNGK